MLRRTVAHNKPVERLRSYPPIALLAVGTFLAATILPSALNITQPNPSQTLEYAPVAGQSDTAPDGGNLSSLGLGSSRSILEASSPESGSSVGAPGQGARPSTKRCVGNPPRQTEDPLSPPCVAFFEGRNGGATSAGVTSEEVRIVIYHIVSSVAPCGSTIDLAEPPTSYERDADYGSLRTLRLYQKYFNDRFQTYGRFVHFWVVTGSCSSGPEARKADAQQIARTIAPFAVVSWASIYNGKEVQEALATSGIVSFDPLGFMPAAFFRNHPRLLYGYHSTFEIYTQLFSSYACKKLIPHRVSFSGNVLDNGQPRKLGLLYADSPNAAWLKQMALEVKGRFEKCGGDFEVVRTFTNPIGYHGDSRDEAAGNMAAFKTAGVTTVIWPGGWNLDHGTAAAAIDYRPEFLLLGLVASDAQSTARLMEPSVWRNAWVVTDKTRTLDYRQQLCYRIARERDPNAPDTDARFPACGTYPVLHQLFTGLQVAGPKLDPVSMDKGIHAIPHVPSTNPDFPACFYHPSDWTCVKDATVSWWDPSGPSQSSVPGCWRLPENGKRYLEGTWPDGDVRTQKGDNDPCNQD